MQTSHRRIAAMGALIAIVAMLGATVPVLADVGDTVLLGRFNRADAKTTIAGDTAGPLVKIANGEGAGLQLVAAKGQAPLIVNSSRRVKKLNADLLDGKSASDFYTRTALDGRLGEGLTITGYALIGDTVTVPATNCTTHSTNNNTLVADLQLPVGVEIVGLTATIYDVSADPGKVDLWRMPAGGGPAQSVIGVQSAYDTGYGTATTALSETVDPGESFFIAYLASTVEAGYPIGLCSVELTFATD